MTRADGATEILAKPTKGRTFAMRRRVRLSDTDAHGHLRLDALFRYMQDVATDDARDAMPEEHLAWVLRRAMVQVDSHPMLEDFVDVTTWCSGYGGRWAERRTSVVGTGGGSIDAVALWVAIDPSSGKPVRVPESFKAAYDEAADGRSVTARLSHGLLADPADETESWVFRASDTDRLGHVNNAAFWSVAEEGLASRRRPASFQAEIEYREPVPARATVELRSGRIDNVWEARLSDQARTFASLRVTAPQ